MGPNTVNFAGSNAQSRANGSSRWRLGINEIRNRSLTDGTAANPNGGLCDYSLNGAMRNRATNLMDINEFLEAEERFM